MRNIEEYKKILDAYDKVSGDIYRILYEFCPSHIAEYNGLLSWEWNSKEECVEIAFLDGRYLHKGRSISLDKLLEWADESCTYHFNLKRELVGDLNEHCRE